MPGNVDVLADADVSRSEGWGDGPAAPAAHGVKQVKVRVRNDPTALCRGGLPARL